MHCVTNKGSKIFTSLLRKEQIPYLIKKGGADKKLDLKKIVIFCAQALVIELTNHKKNIEKDRRNISFNGCIKNNMPLFCGEKMW